MKVKIYSIINSTDSKNVFAQIFDVAVICLIVLNSILVVVETFDFVYLSFKDVFSFIETFSLVFFSLEFILRFWTANLIYPDLKPFKARMKYLRQPMAIIDILAIMPFYLPLFISVNISVLKTIRLFRLLRILKINRYTKALNTVGKVITSKFDQLSSSLFIVFILMIISSVLMYNIEHKAQPELFKNAFSGLWWAVATLTTVGYGDIYPITGLGKLLSGLIAILGIGLVAVPTGIISAGFMEEIQKNKVVDSKVIRFGSECEVVVNENEIIIRPKV